MFGFKSYMSGITGDMTGGHRYAERHSATRPGLTTNGYIVLGISLFFAILCALVMATVLGVLAEDFRSAQMLIMPLVFLVMIPYFISFFADFRTLSLPVKLLVWAIPFSHPFMVTQNFVLG